MPTKHWYKQYFIDLDPNWKLGGCFTAHNTSLSVMESVILEYVESRDDYKTTLAGENNQEFQSVINCQNQ